MERCGLVIKSKNTTKRVGIKGREITREVTKDRDKKRMIKLLNKVLNYKRVGG